MRGFAALALVALLAGCGDAKKSFEDNFNKSFHEKLIASCTTSATGSGMTQGLANKLCTCASDKVKERYSVSEKMNLKSEQLKPIVEECKASIQA
ncbi:MAG: hypothetical protein ACJ8E6_03055 [Sphingomicrobium sp.]